MGTTTRRRDGALDPGAWAVLALVVLLLAGVTAVVAVAGPAEFGPPRTGLLDVDRPFDGLGDRDGSASGAEPGPQQEDGLPGWTTVLWGMTVLALAVLAVRWVFGLLRDEGSRPHDPEAVTVGAPGDLRTLTAVRRAVRDAGAELDGAAPGDVERDVVVRCWLALERAADDAGLDRDPARTPTEFTTALLRAQDADEAATAELLALYHRARFGSTPLDAGAVARAGDALARIATSLGEPVAGPPEGRPGASDVTADVDVRQRRG